MKRSIHVTLASAAALLVTGCASAPTPPGAAGTAGDAIEAARGDTPDVSSSEASKPDMEELAEGEPARAGRQAADEIASSDGPDPMDILGEATGDAARSGASIGAAQSLQGSAMGAAFNAMGGNSGITAEEAQAMEKNIDASEPYEKNGRTCVDYHIEVDDVPGEGDQEQSLTACEQEDGSWEAI
ncbi:hypothetical protein [Thioalkalivibrio sp. ALgr3]|uniref:hypothetical protein n=1 Tax=Thioalkalivibrio sp. ALgr3 TaxID=1239292 RepID=UPI00037C266B|nr:hypothetical protein [Thioalkalivibrio sp. ALgr3]